MCFTAAAAASQREGQRINGPARLESLRIYSRRIEGEVNQRASQANRTGLNLYAARTKCEDDLDVSRAAAQAAVALAEDREASDLLLARALVAADHAIAAHRTAAILAANVAHDFTAAAHEAKIYTANGASPPASSQHGSTRRSRASSVRASGLR